MQVYIANQSKQSLGGGWSFIANLVKAKTYEFTDYDRAVWYFIPSATMVTRAEVEQAKKDGKKVLLRIDNAVRDSRNRNTGMSRLRDFADMADVVVYQSEWARKYLQPFTRVYGAVIHNSVDEAIFNQKNRSTSDNTYIYSRYNRDETKNWEMARYLYSQIQLKHPRAKLYIVGQFSPELVSANFDFFMGENYEYLGVIEDPRKMAEIYRKSKTLLYTYFNDACSNTLIEALLCGCQIKDGYRMAMTGGSDEIIEQYYSEGEQYFHLKRMAEDYRRAIND